MFYKSFDVTDMKKKKLLDKEQECLSCKIDLYETMVKNQQAKIDEFSAVVNSCPPTAPQEINELSARLFAISSLFMKTKLEKASSSREDADIAIENLQTAEGYLDQLKSFNLIGIFFDHAFEELEANQKLIDEGQEIVDKINATLAPSEDEPRS